MPQVQNIRQNMVCDVADLDFRLFVIAGNILTRILLNKLVISIAKYQWISEQTEVLITSSLYLGGSRKNVENKTKFSMSSLLT